MSDRCASPGSCTPGACDPVSTSPSCSRTTLDGSRCSGRRCARGSTSRRSAGTCDPRRRPRSSKTAARPVLITSTALANVARELSPRRLAAAHLRLVIDGELDGYTSYERALAAHPATPLAQEPEGGLMLYSSGTTGRPRGTKPPLSGARFGERPNSLAVLMQSRWGFGPDTVFLCPTPMYHGAPFGFSTCVQRLGGTVVLMDRFDAARALELVESTASPMCSWCRTTSSSCSSSMRRRAPSTTSRACASRSTRSRRARSR